MMGTGVSSLTLLETPVESGAGGGGKVGFVCAWGMGCHSEAGWECDVMDLEVMDVLLFSCCFLATFL